MGDVVKADSHAEARKLAEKVRLFLANGSGVRSIGYEALEELTQLAEGALTREREAVKERDEVKTILASVNSSSLVDALAAVEARAEIYEKTLRAAEGDFRAIKHRIEQGKYGEAATRAYDAGYMTSRALAAAAPEGEKSDA